jgi:voltage-gated potassium channel Kch
MGETASLFVLGYIGIAFVFAALYGAMWRADAHSFAGDGLSSRSGFIDFVYFSMVTLATVGYGEIRPASSVAKVVVIVEIICGVAWVTLILAAAIARAQARDVLPSNPGPQAEA